MEKREDFNSILKYLPPVVVQSSSIFWPPHVLEALKALSYGPHHSKVDSGDVLFLAISDLRHSLNLSTDIIAFSTGEGFSLFFDDLMSRAEAGKWFGEVLPAMASLLMRLPLLLEDHYQKADGVTFADGRRIEGFQCGLRLLDSQHPGFVLLSQELIGALLACSFFCLFPNNHRDAKDLPAINFDSLFASLYVSYNEKQEHKLKCIIHYFERISSSMPEGKVSFERKVLPLEQSLVCISYPTDNSWSKSMVSLCPFEVCSSGLIEDQPKEAIEVDFANSHLGGGALNRGCLQEEIRFMINPELIAGMLFLPSMADNEAIEIVGAERFSHYTGYASSFQFCGDYVDRRGVDFIGRRKTRITAIDALVNPGRRQYELGCLTREINKAFCGFLDHSKCQHYLKIFQNDEVTRPQVDVEDPESLPKNRTSECFCWKKILLCSTCSSNDTHIFSSHGKRALKQDSKAASTFQMKKDLQHELVKNFGGDQDIGIATGNWGCGAFGGDPEIKAIIQWLAASQALRPFISYYTFGLEVLEKLEEVSKWIISNGWMVGELWNMLVEYCLQRLKGETGVGFLSWLLPTP